MKVLFAITWKLQKFNFKRDFKAKQNIDGALSQLPLFLQL